MINATGNRMTREIARQAKLAQDVAQTQIQLSTGKRLQRASDDPVASARVATLRTAQANNVAWDANIRLGQSLTAQADTVLASASDLLVRAKELSLSAANGTLSAADRATVASELNLLAQEMDSLASSRSSTNEPLFAIGTARLIRFDGATLLAPVPSRSAVFDSNGISAAQHMRDAATAISSGNQSAISQSLTALDNAFDQMATVQAQIGLNAARLDRLADIQAETGIMTAAERSSLEDTDFASAVAKLNAQAITLEAAQSAFARINRRSLFDIIG